MHRHAMTVEKVVDSGLELLVTTQMEVVRYFAVVVAASESAVRFVDPTQHD